MDEARSLVGVPVALTYSRDHTGHTIGPTLTLARVDNGNRSYEIQVPITVTAMDDLHRDALTREGAENLSQAKIQSVNDDGEINLRVSLAAKTPVEVATDDPRVNGQAVREFFPNAPVHEPPPNDDRDPPVSLNRSWFDRFRRRIPTSGPRP